MISSGQDDQSDSRASSSDTFVEERDTITVCSIYPVNVVVGLRENGDNQCNMKTFRWQLRQFFNAERFK